MNQVLLFDGTTLTEFQVFDRANPRVYELFTRFHQETIDAQDDRINQMAEKDAEIRRLRVALSGAKVWAGTMACDTTTPPHAVDDCRKCFLVRALGRVLGE